MKKKLYIILLYKKIKEKKEKNMNYDNYTNSGIDKEKGMKVIYTIVFVVLFEFVFGFNNTFDYFYNKLKSNNYVINIGFKKSSDIDDSNKVVTIKLFNKNIFGDNNSIENESNEKEFNLKYFGDKNKTVKRQEIDSDYEYYVRNERMGRDITINNDKSSIYNSLTTRIVHKNNPYKTVELRNPDEEIEKVLPKNRYRNIEKMVYYKNYKELALKNVLRENNGENIDDTEDNRELVVINQ
jgi:hypothetical protein